MLKVSIAYLMCDVIRCDEGKITTCDKILIETRKREKIEV